MSIIVNNSKLRSAALKRHHGRKPNQNRIGELLIEGWSKTEVAKELGISTWPVQKVRKQLKNSGFGSLMDRNRKLRSKKEINND